MAEASTARGSTEVEVWSRKDWSKLEEPAWTAEGWRLSGASRGGEMWREWFKATARRERNWWMMDIEEEASHAASSSSSGQWNREGPKRRR